MQGVRVQAPAYKVVQSYVGQSDVGDLPLSNSGEQVHCKENRSLRRTGAPLRGVARKVMNALINMQQLLTTFSPTGCSADDLALRRRMDPVRGGIRNLQKRVCLSKCVQFLIKYVVTSVSIWPL